MAAAYRLVGAGATFSELCFKDQVFSIDQSRQYAND
jgi:hypothetical protein